MEKAQCTASRRYRVPQIVAVWFRCSEREGAQLPAAQYLDANRYWSSEITLTSEETVQRDKSREVSWTMNEGAGDMLDPSPPVRPILKTATKTGNRTRFIADRNYPSYSQSFHYTNYSSRASSIRGSSSSSSSGRRSSYSVEMASSSSLSATGPSSSRERKRSDEIFLSPGGPDRRVTFSPFTKIKHAPRPTRSILGEEKRTAKETLLSSLSIDR